ncbi:MAG: SCP2 sterol-binding domain-containing protein [Candidatus Alcyoniella australis]|nr:SCP2 sterol-binding domain-containing protein [Candidatus Alcyoniella australis]
MSDLTPKMIFDEKIPENLKNDPGKTAGMNAVYQFNITGDNGGSWFVDLTVDPSAVGEGTSDKANCTITCTDGDFVNIVSGKLNGQMAFMTGKLKIAGDMGLAMKLQKVLG